jgi:hypothetical protein
MEKLGYGTWREYPNSSNCYIGLDADRHRDLLRCFVDLEIKARLYIMKTILETRIKGNSITIQNMVERVLKLMPFACSLNYLQHPGCIIQTLLDITPHYGG